MEKNYTKDILNIISQEIDNYPKELTQDKKVNKRQKLDDQVNRAGGVKQLAQKINSSFDERTSKLLMVGGEVRRTSVLIMFYKIVSQVQTEDGAPYDFTKDAKYNDLFMQYFKAVDANNEMVAQRKGKKNTFSFMSFVKKGEELNKEGSDENSDESSSNGEEPQKIDADKTAEALKNQQLNEFGLLAIGLVAAGIGLLGGIGTAVCKNIPACQKWAKGVASDHPILTKVGKFLTGFDVEEVAKGPENSGSSTEAQQQTVAEAVKKLYASVGLSWATTSAGGASTTAQTKTT